MEDKEDTYLITYKGFIRSAEAICRKFEQLEEWDSLTQAEQLKKGLIEFLEQGIRT